MKIAIIGYSGSGKSTLARAMGARHGVAVLHLDKIHWMPGWQQRTAEESRVLVAGFLAGHPDGWVIDGNYTNLYQERRLAEADRIIFLDFGRWSCLFRVARRTLTSLGKNRADLGEGCPERLNLEFFRWVLYKGRTPRHAAHFREIVRRYPQKTTVLHNQRELDGFYRREGLAP